MTSAPNIVTIPPSVGLGSPPSTAASPIEVTVQMPPERPDYVGDIVGGGIGLVGALLGAVAAYYFGLKATREAKERERKERDRQVDFALIHKLNKVYSSLQGIWKPAVEAEKRLALSRAEAALEQRRFLDHLSLEFRPLATPLARWTFTAEEVARAGSLGGPEIMKVMMVLDDRHNSNADLMDAYRDQKAVFQGMISAAGFDAQSGYLQLAWTDEQYDKVRPHLYQMDATATALREHSGVDVQNTYEAIVAVLVGMAKQRGDKGDTKVTTPDGRVVRVTAKGVDETLAA